MSGREQGNRLPPGAVDTHAHVMRSDAELIAERHSAPACDITLEDFVQVLDEHKVSFGVLTAPSFYGTDNTLLLDALARSEGRLRGTVIVDPSISADALSRMQAAGVAGIRLNWIRRKTIPDTASSEYQHLFGLARDLGLHVELFIEGDLLPLILRDLACSKVRIVIDHFGCPNPDKSVDSPGFTCLLDAVSAGNTWVKLSAPYRCGGADPQMYVDALLAAGGGERLVWASDWPWVSHENTVTYAQCIDLLWQWVPDSRIRHRILVETAQQLFGF